MEKIEYVYHFVSSKDWKKYENQSFYDPPSLKEEGFIHCCIDTQFKYVIDNYFKNIKEIYVLKIHVSSLDVKMLMEKDKREVHFPHIYGIINSDAIEEIIIIKT